MAIGTSMAILGGLMAGGTAASALGARNAANASTQAGQIQAAAGNQAAEDSLAAAQQAGAGVADATGRANQTIAAGTAGANEQLTAQLQAIIDANGPFSAAGQRALAALEQLSQPGAMQFGMNELMQNMDPGYQFRLEQGQRGIEGSAAARGNLLSTRAMREVARFNSGLASQEAANAFSRFANQRDTRLNVLQSLFGAGQQANTQMNAARATIGSAISNNMMDSAGRQAANDLNSSIYGGNALLEGTRQAGDWRTSAAAAQAAGRVGSANAINQGIGQGLNAALGAYSIYRR